MNPAISFYMDIMLAAMMLLGLVAASVFLAFLGVGMLVSLYVYIREVWRDR